MDDVYALLEECGCTFKRHSGRNYALYLKPDGGQITVPAVKGRRVKRTYLQIICRELGLEDELD